MTLTRAELGKVALPSSRPANAPGVFTNATQLTKTVGAITPLKLYLQEPYSEPIAHEKYYFQCVLIGSANECQCDKRTPLFGSITFVLQN